MKDIGSDRNMKLVCRFIDCGLVYFLACYCKSTGDSKAIKFETLPDSH
jgi:hypothetical protein